MFFFFYLLSRVDLHSLDGLDEIVVEITTLVGRIHHHLLTELTEGSIPGHVLRQELCRVFMIPDVLRVHLEEGCEL